MADQLSPVSAFLAVVISHDVLDLNVEKYVLNGELGMPGALGRGFGYVLMVRLFAEGDFLLKGRFLRGCLLAPFLVSLLFFLLRFGRGPGDPPFLDQAIQSVLHLLIEVGLNIGVPLDVPCRVVGPIEGVYDHECVGVHFLQETLLEEAIFGKDFIELVEVLLLADQGPLLVGG